MVTNIINGRIIAGDAILEGVLVLKDGIIQGINRRKSPGATVIDAEGRYVAPGFIDIHTHGAGGADFMDGTVEAYQTATRMHASHGTTLLFPTTCTSSNELLFDSFETYRKAQAYCHDGAVMGGLHLEGPYFAPEQAGAQDPAYLRSPKPEDYEEILEKGGDILKRWSFAPELDGSPAFAAALKARGILASIGHTNATFEECDAAYRSGAEHMTHFFSCMSTVTRRNAYRIAGVVEYGYFQDGMSIEIIADGVHVPKSLLQLVLKIKGVDRIALVTDSMRAAGMPEGKSILGGLAEGREVIVEDGVAKMPDRSCFAGSVATTDRLVRTMVKIAGCSITDAVKMMTLNPARFMGLDARKGTIAPGKDADIVIFDDDIRVSDVLIAGRPIPPVE